MESENCSNEQLNQQSNNRGNGSESLGWHIISILSWILLLFTAWNSYNQNSVFWDSFHSKFYSYIYSYYFPFSMNMPLLKIFVLIISLCGFVVYIIFTTYKKNLNLYNDMLSSWSKFHFIPLLFISALFILGSNIGSYNDLERLERYRYIKMLLIFDIIFTIIALISLIIIYIKTTLNCDWYIVMAIKKGTYSTFIVLLWYNFFYTIICLRTVDCVINDLKERNSNLEDNLISLYKVTGILFPILFALGVFIFSLLFKDLMALFVNFLIYIGMVISFFNASVSMKELRKESFNGEADGIIDIIFMALTLGLIAFIAIRCSHKLF